MSFMMSHYERFPKRNLKDKGTRTEEACITYVMECTYSLACWGWASGPSGRETVCLGLRDYFLAQLITVLTVCSKRMKERVSE